MSDGEGHGINGGFTQKGVEELYRAGIEDTDKPLRDKEAKIVETYNTTGKNVQERTGGQFGLTEELDRGGDTSHYAESPTNKIGTDRLNFTPERRNFLDKLFGRKK